MFDHGGEQQPNAVKENIRHCFEHKLEVEKWERSWAVPWSACARAQVASMLGVNAWSQCLVLMLGVNADSVVMGTSLK